MALGADDICLGGRDADPLGLHNARESSGAGHMVPIERSNEVLAAIREFLE